MELNLIKADCLDFLRDIEKNMVDLIILDPPYLISKKTNFQQGKLTNTDTDRFRISTQFGDWDKEFDLSPIIKECWRVLKNTGTLICFYDLWKISFLKQDLEQIGFCKIRFIEWLKTNPVPINSKISYLTNAREIALVAHKKKKNTFNSQYDNGIYQYPIYQGKDRFHPTQKPLELIKDLILKHSNANDLVLDCFSGSGTTALACILTNRNFTGCEIDNFFYEKSLKRLANI